MAIYKTKQNCNFLIVNLYPDPFLDHGDHFLFLGILSARKLIVFPIMHFCASGFYGKCAYGNDIFSPFHIRQS